MANQKTVSVENDVARATTTLTDKMPTLPLNGPQGQRAIGPRVTFHFISDPWSSANSYEGYDVVQVEGVSYVAIQPVPTGIQLDNTQYWFKWSEPNAQWAELLDTVNTFDKRITENTDAIDAIWYFVDSSMPQSEINDAISSYKNVYFKSGNYSVTAPKGNTSVFKLIDGSNIYLDDVEIQLATTTSDYYNIFDCQGISNYTIKGNATIIGDGATHVETDPDHHWGYGINVTGSKNFTIDGLTFVQMYGDGIYCSYGNSDTKNGVIKNCTFNQNVRQGISVESAINVLIENCIFTNTYGTPGCGIDVEPYQTAASVDRLLISNCYFEGNKRGISVYNNTSKLIVSISDCTILDSVSLSNKVAMFNSVILSNCYIANSSNSQHIALLNCTARSSVILNNCVIDGGNNNDYVIEIGTSTTEDYQYSSFYKNQLYNCEIVNIENCNHIAEFNVFSGQGQFYNYVEFTNLPLTANEYLTSFSTSNADIANITQCGYNIINRRNVTLTDDGPLFGMFSYAITGGDNFYPHSTERIGAKYIEIYNASSSNVSINQLASSISTHSESKTMAANTGTQIPYMNSLKWYVKNA